MVDSVVGKIGLAKVKRSPPIRGFFPEAIDDSIPVGLFANHMPECLDLFELCLLVPGRQ